MSSLVRGRIEATCSSYSSGHSIGIKEENLGPFAWFGEEGERELFFGWEARKGIVFGVGGVGWRVSVGASV